MMFRSVGARVRLPTGTKATILWKLSAAPPHVPFDPRTLTKTLCGTKSGEEQTAYRTLPPELEGKLQTVPQSLEELKVCPVLRMMRGELLVNSSGDLEVDFTDEQWRMVISQGFFQLKVPSWLDTASCDKFSKLWFEAGSHRFQNYKEKAVEGFAQGYIVRGAPRNQLEQFMLSKDNWAYFPHEVQKGAADLVRINLCVLQKVLTICGIPPSIWEEVTSGAAVGKGSLLTSFNMYNPAQDSSNALTMHRDTGWLTVLRSCESGLVAFVDGKLQSVVADPDHLVINFGNMLALLTENTKVPVTASLHGVVRVSQPRVAIAQFNESNLEKQGMFAWTLTKEGAKKRIEPLMDHLMREIKRYQY